jgi:ribonuclease HI
MAMPLRPLLRRARALADGLPVTFSWVPRERNAEADALAHQAYDEVRGSGEPSLGSLATDQGD